MLKRIEDLLMSEGEAWQLKLPCLQLNQLATAQMTAGKVSHDFEREGGFMSQL